MTNVISQFYQKSLSLCPRLMLYLKYKGVMSMKEFLAVKNLVKNYGDFCAVDNLSFSVCEGEIFGLLGPNGAGKSTTMNVINSLTDFEKGSVTVDGADLVKDKEKIKRMIGMVPQEIALYPFLSAEENVRFFASLYGLKGRELKAAAQEALRFVGLSDRAGMKPKKMSGGMQRRLNIACGIAHNPRLIIMDEPTVGVDAQSREHILSSVRTLRERGATVIYTSHYMNEVEEICDRIAIIDHGQLIACGTEAELIALVSESKSLKIQTQLPADFDSAGFIAELTKLPDVKSGRINENEITLEMGSICRDYTFIFERLQRHGLPVAEISSRSMNLEDVFIAMTGRELR